MGSGNLTKLLEGTSFRTQGIYLYIFITT